METPCNSRGWPLLCAVKLAGRTIASFPGIPTGQAEALWPELADLPQGSHLQLICDTAGGGSPFGITAHSGKAVGDGKNLYLEGADELFKSLGVKIGDTVSLARLPRDGLMFAELNTAEGLALLQRYGGDSPQPVKQRARAAREAAQGARDAAAAQAAAGGDAQPPAEGPAAAAAGAAAAAVTPGRQQRGKAAAKRARQAPAAAEHVVAAARAGSAAEAASEQAGAGKKRKKGRPAKKPAAAAAATAMPVVAPAVDEPTNMQLDAEPGSPGEAPAAPEAAPAGLPPAQRQAHAEQGAEASRAGGKRTGGKPAGRRGRPPGRNAAGQPAAAAARPVDAAAPAGPEENVPGQVVPDPALGGAPASAQDGPAAQQASSWGAAVVQPAQQLRASQPAAAVAPSGKPGGRKRGRKPLSEKQAQQAPPLPLAWDRPEGQEKDYETAAGTAALLQPPPAPTPDLQPPLAAAAAPAARATEVAAAAPAAPAEVAGGQYSEGYEGAYMLDGDSEDEEAFFARLDREQRLRPRKVTGNREGVRDLASQPGADDGAAALSPGGSKRMRKASVKVAENAETDALLHQLTSGGAQQWSQQQQAQQQPGDQPAEAAGPKSRAARRRGGMGGFGGRADKGRPYQPIPLLPGEQALGVELHFGEGRPHLANGRVTQPPGEDSGEGSSLPPTERYGAAVQRARDLLSQRMRGQGASESEVDDMLRLLRAFEAKCLAGSEPCSPAEGRQLCVELNRRLRAVYNQPGQAPLVLDAHVLSGRALEEQEGGDDLQHLRVMERRFIIWTPPDLNAEQVQRCAGTSGPCLPADTLAEPLVPAAATATAPADVADASQRGAAYVRPPRGSAAAPSRLVNFVAAVRSFLPGRGSAAGEGTAQQQQQQGGEEPQQPAGGGRAASGSAWDRGLAGLWGEFTRRLQGKRYGDITLSTVQQNVSCALNDTEWKEGQLKRVGVKQAASVLSQIKKCHKGVRTGRLYVTDGSMPDYELQDYPADAPGMPCGIDSGANAILPHAVRSCRATSLFHTLKNESTGTKTFTLFGPAGGGTNLTAFHFETKRRRSYNLGTGDFIIQPLATQEVMRKLMRVHAAVAGRHTRHGQLLPLEVYLEEGVPLVLHVRDYPFATLCEQSMHAFVSFGTVACEPPCLKVSCNDCDLLWELDSCYWLEKLATAYKEQRLFPEEAVPPDGADTWVMSAYLLRKPHTLAQKRAGWERPWLCEAKGADLAAALAGSGPDGELEDCDMHWSADIMTVRCVEKMLDVLAGLLREAASWAGALPDQGTALRVLRRTRPVLQDMHNRAASEDNGPVDAAGEFVPRWPLQCHFSREYLADLMGQVDRGLAEAVGAAAGAGPAGGSEAVAAAAAAEAEPAAAARRQREEQAPPAVLLTPHVHAAYAASVDAGDGHAAELVRWADEMLQAAQGAGSSHGQSSGSAGAAPPEAPAPAAAALSTLPPAVLRAHWLLRLQLEWEALVAQPRSLQLLARRRAQRSQAEALLDRACRQLAEQHRSDWGVLA